MSEGSAAEANAGRLTIARLHALVSGVSFAWTCGLVGEDRRYWREGEMDHDCFNADPWRRHEIGIHAILGRDPMAGVTKKWTTTTA